MCNKNRAKEYYKNNRDVMLNRSKEYYINNKESILEYLKNKCQSLTEDKKQKIKDYQKEYQKEYKKNMSHEQKQKLKDYSKEYYKKYYAEKKLKNKKLFICPVIIKGYKFVVFANFDQVKKIVILLTLGKQKKNFFLLFC